MLSALLSGVVSILMRKLMKPEYAIKAMLWAAEELAERSDNKVDDEVVVALRKALE